MFLIYPFNLKENEKLNNNQNHIEYFLNDYLFEFKQYYLIYGKEATWFAVLMHSKNNSLINEKFLIKSWKNMNKIYTLMNNLVNYECEKFLIFYNKALKYLKQNKLHLYAAMLMHIIKYCKLNENYKKKFKELLFFCVYL